MTLWYISPVEKLIVGKRDIIPTGVRHVLTRATSSSSFRGWIMRLGGFPRPILLASATCRAINHSSVAPVAGTADNASRASESNPLARAHARASARLNAPSRLIDRSINVKWPSNGPATQPGSHLPRICKRGQLRVPRDSFYLPFPSTKFHFEWSFNRGWCRFKLLLFNPSVNERISKGVLKAILHVNS